MRSKWKSLVQHIRSVSLVDRFLILFMGVLLLYMVVHLWCGAAILGDTRTSDVIVRTSAAAIFGYFISGNFTKSGTAASTFQTISNGPPSIESPSSGSSSAPSDRLPIGFQAHSTTETATTTTPPALTPGTATHSSHREQIIIVSCIGFVSLLILIFTSNLSEFNEELTAMISQLRDFLSACIGFLISCGKNTDA